MAENEQAEGGEGASPAPKGNKFKLIVIVAGVLALLGCGSALYFFFASHRSEEQHAEAAQPKPPVLLQQQVMHQRRRKRQI